MSYVQVSPDGTGKLIATNEVNGQQIQIVNIADGFDEFYWSEYDIKKYRKHLESLISASNNKKVTRGTRKAAKVISELPVKTKAINKVLDKSYGIDFDLLSSDIIAIQEHLTLMMRRLDEIRNRKRQEEDTILTLLLSV